MSRHAGGWEFAHIIATVGAIIIMSGTVAGPAIASHADSHPAASKVTVTGTENNWG